MDDLCLEYFDFYQKYPGEANLKILRAHMHKFLHSGFTVHGHTDLRDKLNKVNAKPENIEVFKEIALEMKERRRNIPPIDKITWYYRHWKDEMPKALGGLKNKDQMMDSCITDCSWDEWMLADPRNPQSQKVKDEKELER